MNCKNPEIANLIHCPSENASYQLSSIVNSDWNTTASDCLLPEKCKHPEGTPSQTAAATFNIIIFERLSLPLLWLLGILVTVSPPPPHHSYIAHTNARRICPFCRQLVMNDAKCGLEKYHPFIRLSGRICLSYKQLYDLADLAASTLSDNWHGEKSSHSFSCCFVLPAFLWCLSGEVEFLILFRLCSSGKFVIYFPNPVKSKPSSFLLSFYDSHTVCIYVADKQWTRRLWIWHARVLPLAMLWLHNL